jgi:hypothetical protein
MRTFRYQAGSSSIAVEVLQQLNERNEKSEVKQEKEMEDLMLVWYFMMQLIAP